jgi:hypothetical protein
MFEIKDLTSSQITMVSSFSFDLLGSDGKFSLIMEAQEKKNPERKSNCEIVITFEVDRFPPIFKETFYTANIANPKVDYLCSFPNYHNIKL